MARVKPATAPDESRMPSLIENHQTVYLKTIEDRQLFAKNIVCLRNIKTGLYTFEAIAKKRKEKQ